MKTILRRILIYSFMTFAIVISLSGCNNIPKVDWEVKMTGAVTSPITFSFEELTELEQIDLNNVFMSKTYGEDEYRSFTGVPIEKLMDLAGASKDVVSITTFAADGYAIEIPLADLEGGILAIKDGGEWIIKKEPDSGPLRLVLPKTPASSWVFQVIEIQINK